MNIRVNQGKIFSVKGAALTLLLATLPLLWITLFEISGLDFKPVHICVLLIFTSFALLSSKITIFNNLNSVSSGFVVLYFVYIISYLLTLLWSSEASVALPIIIKLTIYFATFVFIASLVASSDELLTSKIFFWGSVWGILFYEAILIVVFALQNKFVFLEYFRAITSGDVLKLRYGFHKVVFDYFLDEFGNNSDSITRSIALVNTLIGAFFLFAFCLLSVAGKFRISKRLCYFLFIVCLLIVLVSTSRTNQGVFILGLLIYWYINSKAKVRMKSVILSITILMLLSFSLIFFADASNIYTAIFERFSNLFDDARWDSLAPTIAIIQEHPLLGNGVGTTVWARKDYLRVHNLFLGSWVDGGGLSLILSISFYLTLVIIWMKFIFTIKHSPRYWILNINPSCIAVLPTLPLLRCWFSGASGAFNLIEWSCLALFFGLMAKNKIDKKRIAAHERLNPNLQASINQNLY